MSVEKVRSLTHKSDLHKQQINAKHLITKELRENIAKRCKMEKEDRKVELVARNEQAIFTIGYYGSNILGLFFIFISYLSY